MSINTGRQTCLACMSSVNLPAPASMAQTGWRATHCWSVSCSHKVRPSTITQTIERTNVKPDPWDDSRVRDSDEEVVLQHNWQELRRLMWDYVGIVRTSRRLDHAAARIALLEREVSGYYARFQITKPLLEMRNLARVAQLMVQCAMEPRRKPWPALQLRLSQCWPSWSRFRARATKF